MKSALTILFFVLLGGCVPATYIAVPALRGRVVDSDAKPIPGATVRINIVGGNASPAEIITGSDGRFTRPEESRFTFYIIPGDWAFYRYDVLATHEKKRSPTTQVAGGVRYLWTAGPPRSGIDLGDMRLR